MSSIKVAARSSPLSRAQVAEVLGLLKQVHPQITFQEIWVRTTGDCDRTTSLRTLGQTNFFTKQVDDLVLSKQCQVGIHSAKDLPLPLTDGLELIALTNGLDPGDSLVMRESSLPPNGCVATSSVRREEAVKLVYPDARFIDLRGTIAERLAKLDGGEVDGVVVAEAALIRLGLTHLPRLQLPGNTTPMQGKLAVIARIDDEEMKQLFTCIHDYETDSLSRA